jgi:hypothetical protein
LRKQAGAVRTYLLKILRRDSEDSLLPRAWKPVAATNLRRVGPADDGGYVVSSAAIADSDVLLSMGLNDDWRFEQAFQQESGARVICYDGSVDRRFWQLYIVKKLLRLRPFQALKYRAYRRFFGSGNAEHRQVMIGYDGEESVSLSTILKELRSNRIFLKVDIEGWEYRILEQIAEHRDRLTGVVMELHDIDLHRDRIDAFVHAMAGFVIIHLTANNFGPVDPTGDPVVVEISMMRDRYVERPDGPGKGVEIPHVRNAPDRPDIILRYA